MMLHLATRGNLIVPATIRPRDDSPQAVRQDREKSRSLFQKVMDQAYLKPLQNELPVLRQTEDGLMKQFYKGRNLVFTETRDGKLETRSASPETVRQMIVRLRDRGVQKLTVEGSDSFRRAVWLYGGQQGMEVHGYQPAEKDKGTLAYLRENAPIQQKRQTAKDAPSQEKSGLSKEAVNPKPVTAPEKEQTKQEPVLQLFPERNRAKTSETAEPAQELKSQKPAPDTTFPSNKVPQKSKPMRGRG